MPKSDVAERKADHLRHEIADTAFALFLARNFESVTFDDVARAAGISRRTLFRYFETKEDLVVWEFESFGEVLAKTVLMRPAQEPPFTAVRRGLVAAAQRLGGQPRL